MNKIFILLCLLLAGCQMSQVSIGDLAISHEDIEYRAQVSEMFYPGSGQQIIAMSQLIKGYLSLEVLKAQGNKVDNAVLEAEARRINENTKAPEVLKKIRDVYGSDRKAYLKTFVAVVYAERVLFNEVFLKSPDVQKDVRARAEAFLALASRDPGSLTIEARKAGFASTRLRLSLKKGILPADGRSGRPFQSSEASVPEAERVIKLLSAIRAGDVYPRVFEWQESFQIVRYLKRAGQDYLVESVTIPKKSYNDWFWEQASQIPVTINDQTLKEELLRQVPWARNIRMVG